MTTEKAELDLGNAPKRRRSSVQKETDAIAEIVRALKAIKVERRVTVMRAVDAMLGGKSGHDARTIAPNTGI